MCKTKQQTKNFQNTYTELKYNVYFVYFLCAYMPVLQALIHFIINFKFCVASSRTCQFIKTLFPFGR